MHQADRVLDQEYLLKTAANLARQRVEIQQLREAVEAAEASRNFRSGERMLGAVSPALGDFASQA